MNLSDDFTSLKKAITNQLGDGSDLVFRSAGDALVMYISVLVHEDRLEREIIKPLTDSDGFHIERITTPNLHETQELSAVIEAILSGSVAIARRGEEKVLLASLTSMPSRGVEAPETEASIRGPREGFTELMETNMALIRRILRTDKLRMKVWHIGDLTKTEVRLLYLEGITPEELVKETSNRLSAIKMDAVLESNYIEEMIRDHPWSIFPTLQFTQRPDVVAASLLEGKVTILTANTPFVLVAPFQFWSAFTANEDYYLNYASATFLRLIRFVATVVSLLLPSLYVAIITFHPEMVPTKLLLSIASTREPSPLPVIVEAFLMEVTFEALREAALRLPRSMGQTVSIVGALVIGQAVVQAGIISVPMVVVVSVTGITSLMFPRYNITFAIRMLRFFILLLAGSLGLFGVVIGLFIISIYLTGIRSVGVPYMSPVAPLNIKGLKDLVVRLPIWFMNNENQINLVKESMEQVTDDDARNDLFNVHHRPIVNREQAPKNREKGKPKS